MRRTVKDAPTPSPRLLITTPSNACNRSFSPSMTFTEIFTVSPGVKPPRSFLSSPASTMRIAPMVPVSSIDQVGRRPAVSQAVQPLLLLRGQIRRLQQVGPPLPRPGERHDLAPSGDLAVIPRQQDVGHCPLAEDLGPRVLRVFEEAARERILRGRGGVAEYPGHETRHRLRHHQRG